MRPLTSLPGTRQRKAELAERARAGQPLTQAGDLLSDPGRRADYRRSANGRDVIRSDADVVVRVDPGEKVCVTTHGIDGPARLSALACRGLEGIGQRLRAARLARRLSMGQVSLATGIGKSTLRDLEIGRNRQPTLAVLWLLADCYRCTLDELAGRGEYRGHFRPPIEERSCQT